MSIPLIDLKAQYLTHQDEIDAAMRRVLERAQYILGPENEAFEQALAEYAGVKHAIGVASGTDALILALLAYGIGPGDEVITTAFSFFATAEAIAHVGAMPVFCDIDPETYTIDVSQIETQVGSNTKAILPVHLYGHAAAMDEIMRIAQKHGLIVIEDCAQALGGSFKGKRLGAIGHCGAVSFYPSKNLGAYGDGGMVLTNDAEVNAKIRELRIHGASQRYTHAVIGMNSRLDELQAAVLGVKLRYLDDWNRARIERARRYTQLFRERKTPVRLPVEREACIHVYHLYCIQTDRRDAVIQALTEAEIAHQIAYPSILPDQQAFKRYPYRSTHCHEARKAAASILALPLYPEISDAAIAKVVDTVHAAATQ